MFRTFLDNDFGVDSPSGHVDLDIFVKLFQHKPSVMGAALLCEDEHGYEHGCNCFCLIHADELSLVGLVIASRVVLSAKLLVCTRL